MGAIDILAELSWILGGALWVLVERLLQALAEFLRCPIDIAEVLL